MTTTTDQQLRQYIERVEQLKSEAKGIGEDIRDTFMEAKSQGYDPRIMRQVIKLRAMNPNDRAELDALLDTYCCAVGLQMDLPLGVAA